MVRFGEWRSIEDPAGPVEVWTPPAPGWKYRYIIGAAVAGGTCCACVLDRGEPVHVAKSEGGTVTTYEGRAVAAELYGPLSAASFAEQIRRLNRFYSCAVVVPVVNPGGLAVIEKLKGRPYVYVYQRRDRADDARGSISDNLGFALTDATREGFFGELAAWIASEEGLQAPEEYFNEMLSLGRDEKGRLPAEVTTRNLRTVALAAAIQGHATASGVRPPEQRRVRDAYDEGEEEEDLRTPLQRAFGKRSALAGTFRSLN